MMREKCKSPIQETANVCRLLHFLYIKKWKCKILSYFLHLLRITDCLQEFTANFRTKLYLLVWEKRLDKVHNQNENFTGLNKSH
jgi:hypothetical protein